MNEHLLKANQTVFTVFFAAVGAMWVLGRLGELYPTLITVAILTNAVASFVLWIQPVVQGPGFAEKVITTRRTTIIFLEDQ